jgi:hypothetical protein
VLPFSPSVVYGADYGQMRRASRHRAHVVVTMGGAPGLALLNAESFRAPSVRQRLQVSSVERDRVMAALGTLGGDACRDRRDAHADPSAQHRRDPFPVAIGAVRRWS